MDVLLSKTVVNIDHEQTVPNACVKLGDAMNDLQAQQEKKKQTNKKKKRRRRNINEKYQSVIFISA